MNMQTQDCYIPAETYDAGDYLQKYLVGMMEKRSGVIILTPEELRERDKKIAGDAFDAGREAEFDYAYKSGEVKAPDKNEYINNLITS